MKKFVYFLMVLGLVLTVVSCSSKNDGPQKWEYKTVKIWGGPFNDFTGRDFSPETAKALGQEIDLDSLGEEGWELVTVTPIIETVHPNFGDKRYVTGLQPNTRTAGYTYIFKRLRLEGERVEATEQPKEEAVIDEVEGVDTVAAAVDSVAAID